MAASARTPLLRTAPARRGSAAAPDPSRGSTRSDQTRRLPARERHNTAEGDGGRCPYSARPRPRRSNRMWRHRAPTEAAAICARRVRSPVPGSGWPGGPQPSRARKKVRTPCGPPAESETWAGPSSANRLAEKDISAGSRPPSVCRVLSRVRTPRTRRGAVRATGSWPSNPAAVHRRRPLRARPRCRLKQDASAPCFLSKCYQYAPCRARCPGGAPCRGERRRSPEQQRRGFRPEAVGREPPDRGLAPPWPLPARAPLGPMPAASGGPRLAAKGLIGPHWVVSGEC